MYLLDSSAIIELLAGSERGRKIKDLIGEDVLVSTAISLVEVLSGTQGNMATTASQFFKAIDSLPFDREAASESLEIERHLREHGKPAEWSDVFIAGICKKHRITLVTCDTGFRHMPMIEAKIVL